MATRIAMLKCAGSEMTSLLGFRRRIHVPSLPPLLDAASDRTMSPSFILPEFNRDSEKNKNNELGFGIPSFSFGGSMELMAVPKKKVSPHKRGIRNGPRALKPVPVIVRCKCCGRVKLPHFYCCSGTREKTGGQNGSTS